MSREVQGDAPADAGVRTAVRRPVGAPGRTSLPEQVGGSGGWRGAGIRIGGGRGPGDAPGRRAVALLVAVLLAGAAGWTAAGAWQPPEDAPAVDAVTAVMIDARADGNRPSPVRGRARITVSNDGTEPVSVVGFEPGRDGGFVVGLDPRRLDLPAGGRGDLQLQIAVRCGSAAPLELPGLRIRRADGGIRPVPLTGDAAALATLCAGWPRQEPLVVDEIRPDGDRLALVVRVPGGRSTRIDAISAGAVPLVVSALPTTVDGGGTTIWLRPPPRCPVRWQRSGIPQRISVRADLGSPAELTLTLGPALADWVLATACRTVTG